MLLSKYMVKKEQRRISVWGLLGLNAPFNPCSFLTISLNPPVATVSLFQRTVATGGSQFVFFRPPLLHKFELVWAYLLLPFGLWVDGNPLGTPELKNRSYLPNFFVTKGCLGSRPLDSIWRKSGPGSRALPKQRPAKRTHPNRTSTGEL